MVASKIAISAAEFRWLEKSSLSCNFCVSLWPNSSSYRNPSTLDLVRTFLDPQTMWWTPKLTLYDKQWLIYCSSNAKAAILDAILKITLFWLPDDNLTGLNGFLDPQNHSVDTKITTLRQTVADLLQF